MDGESALEALLRAAVTEALRTGQPEPFLRWMRENAPSLLAGLVPKAEPADLVALAAQFGYGIWNALPLPGNGFRPRPLPKPHRNDPCICGSGLKYKRCCADVPELPPFQPEAIWMIMVELLPAEILAEAVEHRRIPAEVLVKVAELYLDEGDADTVVSWLEPYFSGDLKHLRHEHGPALYVLCDAYDALGQPQRKFGLLEQAVKHAPKELASDAAQRLVTIALDRYDYQSARRYFQQAMRLNSDDPLLSILELQLLLGEGDTNLARQRAGFWLQRLQRGSYELSSGLMDALTRAQDDPARALSALFTPMMSDTMEELRVWITRIETQPVSPYRLEPVESFADEEGAGNPHAFEPPVQLADLERRWHELYPAEKPFGTSLMPMNVQGINPLEPGVAEPWLDFLRAHPEAADSLDILDDLLLLLLGSGMDEQPWLVDQFLRPVLSRARAIVQASLDATDEAVTLPWVFMQNRPALRLLNEAMGDLQDQALIDGLGWLLQLNPGDNHGQRSLLMDLLLQDGRDTEALALAARYPDDMLPEILYGRALALHCLGDRAAATEALDLALERLPKVAAFLTGRRRAQPEQEYPGLVTVGGADQAYLYAAGMRSVWQDSPGALDLVRRRVRARKQA
jgi:tetratricopeptide (TPR) repeat protein